MQDLSCERVTKSFGGFTAVDDVSMSVPAGSFFSILGPSGCGKTTLMRMIAGFETPTAGDIRIRGESVLGVAPNRRNVKMVFQHLALFPMMSVGENVAYGLRCRGEKRAEIAPKVARVLDRVGLPGVEDKRVEQLSGGQKQRIAIARCMVLDPDVLLLDEPLGALDLKLRERMKIELKEMQTRFETTFLYITHDQSEALVMSDTVAVMNAGRFEQIGPPKALYDEPVSGFVAGFVGDANCLPGRLAEVRGDEGRVDLDGGGTVVGRLGDRSRPGEAVELFLRPEAVTIAAADHPAAADGALTLPGRVASLLFNGAASRVLVRLASGRLVEAADREQGAALDPGEAVALSWRPERARVFARRTGDGA
ncbi:MAG: ABC transporter ATP-binding protein [Paracoccaceae bacterium]